ncbi:hypothetical protein MUK42_00509 [Musa troglodytarum]|uniref:Uncharacterized protein n=1 Tax=Musa troglodytarum TaxID=320322 RepID=A0A9E7FDV4_9LILI|nr:hypothetical protein MUK42_00509 [Musa troglodytarum]
MEDGCLTAEKPSFRRTLVIQVALCLALYAAFHIGAPQPPPSSSPGGARLGGKPADLYFLSVRGGVRTPREQSQLLEQMERAAKTYKASFVVNIAELGDRDPLLQNATSHFPLEIPWYTTPASGGQMIASFLKRFRLPYEQTLDIIGTGSLQDFSYEEQLNKNGSNNLHWMRRTLATSNSTWLIVVGFDPMIICDEKEATGTIKFNKPLHNVFLEFGVDAYLSKQDCGGYFYHVEGIAYMGNPGPADKLNRALSINVNPDVPRQVGILGLGEMHNGFLLHRVSPLEMESYFIDSSGRIALKTMIRHHGRGAI